MATGDAAESGDSQCPPKWGKKADGVIAGDALEFDVATDRTVRGKSTRKRNLARAKANIAAGASPRDIADKRSEVIKKATPAGPAAIHRLTNWANHSFLTFPGDLILPMLLKNFGRSKAVFPQGCRKPNDVCKGSAIRSIVRRIHGRLYERPRQGGN